MSKGQLIGNLLPKTRSQMNRLNSPAESCHGALANATQEVATIISTYESEDKFLSIFSPSKQVAFTRDLERTFCGKAPTLALVAKAFGCGARDNWLDIQLTELAAFSGCKDKLTEHQVQSLIDIIAEEYSFLKVTELMFFFHKFKAGEYGKFYGAVDPLTITCALKDFCDDRRTILSRIEKRRQEMRQRNNPEHIRYLRKSAERERMSRFYYVNFRSKDFSLDDFAQIWWLFNLGYERSNHGYNEW